MPLATRPSRPANLVVPHWVRALEIELKIEEEPLQWIVVDFLFRLGRWLGWLGWFRPRGRIAWLIPYRASR